MEMEAEQVEVTKQITGTLNRKGESTIMVDQHNLQQIIGPLMKEFKLLRETVDKNYTELNEVQKEISSHQKEVSQDLQNFENTISTQRKEIMEEIGEKLEYTNKKMDAIMLENRQLKKENQNLGECLDQLEMVQLSNIIITGIEEQTWEPAEATKQRVYDTIVATMTTSDGNLALEEAYKVDIMYCARLGKYRSNANRPISITFQRKDRLMQTKSRLPPGIYVNNKYPIEVKRRCDRLQSIFRMVKSLPKYRDHCKLNGDTLIVNGVRYTVDEIHKLPPDLAAYTSSEKRNDSYLAFHGEWSPYSNFHPSPFELGGNSFETAEQYIQYHKVLFFGDT